LPEDEQLYIRRNHMVAYGIEPEVVSDRDGYASVDEWADEWVRAIRTVRRGGDDEWGEEPEPDEGDIVERALAHVVAGATLSAFEADALVRAVRSAQGLTVEQLSAPTKIPRVSALVDSAELAKLMGVRPGTIRQWKMRGKLPEPSEVIGGRPAWGRAIITGWIDECRLAV